MHQRNCVDILQAAYQYQSVVGYVCLLKYDDAVRQHMINDKHLVLMPLCAAVRRAIAVLVRKSGLLLTILQE